MKKGVKKQLLEEKEVFDLNIRSLSKELKENDFFEELYFYLFDKVSELKLEDYNKTIEEIKKQYVSNIVEFHDVALENCLNKSIIPSIDEIDEFLEKQNQFFDIVNVLEKNNIFISSELKNDFIVNLYKEFHNSLRMFTNKILSSMCLYFNDIICEEDNIMEKINKKSLLNLYYKLTKSFTYEYNSLLNSLKVEKKEFLDILTPLFMKDELGKIIGVVDSKVLNSLLSTLALYQKQMLLDLQNYMVQCDYDSKYDLLSIKNNMLNIISKYAKEITIDSNKLNNNFILNILNSLELPDTEFYRFEDLLKSTLMVCVEKTEIVINKQVRVCISEIEKYNNKLVTVIEKAENKEIGPIDLEVIYSNKMLITDDLFRI